MESLQCTVNCDAYGMTSDGEAIRIPEGAKYLPTHVREQAGILLLYGCASISKTDRMQLWIPLEQVESHGHHLAQVKFDFMQSNIDKALSIRKGQIVWITSISSDWYIGRPTSNLKLKGIFPCAYVEPLWDVHDTVDDSINTSVDSHAIKPMSNPMNKRMSEPMNKPMQNHTSKPMKNALSDRMNIVSESMNITASDPMNNNKPMNNPINNAMNDENLSNTPFHESPERTTNWKKLDTTTSIEIESNRNKNYSIDPSVRRRDNFQLDIQQIPRHSDSDESLASLCFQQLKDSFGSVLFEDDLKHHCSLQFGSFLMKYLNYIKCNLDKRDVIEKQEQTIEALKHDIQLINRKVKCYENYIYLKDFMNTSLG